MEFKGYREEEKSICWKRFKGVKDKLQFKTQPKNMRLSIQKAT